MNLILFSKDNVNIYINILMGKTVYSRQPPTGPKSAKTSARDLRIHYKNTYETAKTIKGLTIAKAKAYLKDILAQRRYIPFTRHYEGFKEQGKLKNLRKHW
jgi:large subunit ribosomal protein L17e